MAGIKKESHKPHGKMGNPNPPQTPEFKARQQKPLGDYNEPFGKTVFSFKCPESIEAALLNVPKTERTEFIRKAVIRALEGRNDG